MSVAHKVRRFVWSLAARAPSTEDIAWAHSLLSEHERRAFDRMTPRDKAHSVAVARAVQRHLDAGAATTGPESPEVDGPGSDSSASERDRRDWMLTAALTHDVGKSVTRLGTYGRVVATVCAATMGESMAPLWAERSGIVRRIGLYLQYPRLGADILRLAGSDERVIAWAEQHHLEEEFWSVPLPDGRVLVAADDGDL